MVDLRNSGAVDYESLTRTKSERKVKAYGDGGYESGIMIRRILSTGRLRDRACSPVEIGLPGDPCRSSQSLIIRNQQRHLIVGDIRLTTARAGGRLIVSWEDSTF